MGMSGLPQLTAELDAKEPGVHCVGLIEEIADPLRSDFPSGKLGARQHLPFNFKKDFSHTHSHILAKPRFAKSAKSSSCL